MPPRQIREQSWNSLHHSEASGDNVDSGYSDASMGEESDDHSEGSPTESRNYPTLGEVRRDLHPLQATADRVGKQVEQFAENLDRLSVRKQKQTRKDVSHVLPLVNAYKNIASQTVKHLGTMHAPERRQQLAKKTKRMLRKSSGQSTPALNPTEEVKELDRITTVEDLRYWEQEEQTWDLLGLMLQVEYPVLDSAQSGRDFKPQIIRPSKSKQLHRYSPENDVWDSFIASDDQAWERNTVINWLKRCADKNGQDIEQVVQELETGADRGSGLWAHSWLYSKEAIKGQKRLRSWPKALEPDDPGLDVSLLNMEKTQALVTQLDPDAITRQNRVLERQDQFFERATWLACWEMIRRGKDWKDIHEWCEDRVENWRATAMHGDARNVVSTNSSIVNWQARDLWRKACALAAKEGGIDEYENAVYGALSGYLPSVLKVSRNWDDHLFAHYNSYLLHSFEEYVKNSFGHRGPNVLVDQHSSFNFSTFGGQRVQDGAQLVERMKHLDATKAEAREPMKMLQGSLVAKTFGDFVFKHGVRLSISANITARSKIMLPIRAKILEGSIAADLRTTDYELLRLITHIIFIYQDLGFDFGEGDRRCAMESIVVAYIDFLSKAGKQQLLPLYASRLSSQRSVSCLGRHLPSILDHGERQTFMRLMAQEDIDVTAVLTSQLVTIITDMETPKGKKSPFPTLRILEETSKDASIPRQIEPDFLGTDISDDQRDLIRGFEWYLILDGHWRQTMMVGAIIYKHFLRIQALSAARMLSQTIQFSKISMSKTKAILGQSCDISKPEVQSDGGEDQDHNSQSAMGRSSRIESRPRSSSLRPVSNERDIMLGQARSFRDFEQLGNAFDALVKWKQMADEGNKYANPLSAGRVWRDAFEKAHKSVDSIFQGLFNSWLQDPQSDVEVGEFKEIRVAYLPELVLAYHTVMDYGSRVISRDLLFKAMDLAPVIAAEDSALGACFMAADRMAELVDSFAFLSKTMIVAEDRGGKGGKSKKRRGGEKLDLWTVRASSP